MPRYPLSEHMREALDAITLDAVLEDRVTIEDLQVTPDALEAQAAIALEAGRPQLAENLLRAAELANVPEQEILRVYNALRPGRGSAADLAAVAADMEARYGARRCADLIREAAVCCGR